MLAHGALLRKNFFSADELIAIVKDFHNSSLTDEEVAIMAFAKKISSQAQEINEQDYEQLRAFGLRDEEILDIVLACTARNFFSKTLDALGAEPDDIYQELEPELVQVLAIGRPFPSH
jgi:alkylhydroperoxidase family enzyme